MARGQTYEIIISPRARKRFKKLPKDSQKKIYSSLQALKEEPLTGYPLEKPFTQYRSLKVKANRVEYRIIHQVKATSGEVWINLIEPREEVYKKLKNLLRQ
ncbi:type II toxin-antitoxin system RelE family toxin [Candidatus Leptofilum sp.]|uniref:type II toxin-antitoxin system RelE family toxin n=1 Tax=Candidatus Leptofilum sp. TaxID=3241576 RepID=UPI003B59067D